MMIFAPSHSVVLGRAIAGSLDLAVSPSEEREFDGGEHKMRPLVDVAGSDVCVVQSTCGNAAASANDKLCRLLFFIGALKDAGARYVTACVPYLAYARKDRRTQKHDPVTTRYVAELFEAVGTDRLIVLDVHNEAAFDNACRIPAVRVEAAAVFAEEIVRRWGDRHVVVAAPDVGGIKRAQRMRELLSGHLSGKVDFAFVEKRRASGVVSGEALVGNVENATVLLHDDMIASGTTILRAAQAARRAGATAVHAVATHAAFQRAALRLFEPAGPDTLLVSDSIPLTAPFASLAGERLRICSTAPLLARAIAGLHTGGSTLRSTT